MAFRTNKVPTIEERTVSGSSVSFNSAFALPLKACKVSFSATQAGSGEPSPSNVRPIHGFSEVNATRCGVNLFNINNLTATDITISDNVAFGTVSSFYNAFKSASGGIPNLPKFKTNTRYTFSLKAKYDTNSYGEAEGLYFNAYYTDGTRSRLLSDFISLDTTDYITFTGTTEANKTLDRITITYGTGGPVNIYLKDIQLEESLQATSYKPYTGNIYTIQLGQEVYGAEVDVVNGVAHCTHGYRVYNGSESGWGETSSDNKYFTIPRSGMPTSGNFIANTIKKASYGSANYIGYIGGSYFNVRYTQNMTLTEFKDMLSQQNLEVVYELATPFDIQLTPQQIQTLIGNNTIFADTGDIDLTYKDLDIAKRGNLEKCLSCRVKEGEK